MISRDLLSEAQGVYPTVQRNKDWIVRVLFLQFMIKMDWGKSDEAYKLRSDAGFFAAAAGLRHTLRNRHA